jgi:putative DNA primase/helicase
MTSALEISAALRAQKSGGVHTAACPSCGYKGALSIRDDGGRPLVRCHVGCEQADVLQALRSLGFWHGRTGDRPSYQPARSLRSEISTDDVQKAAWARDLWQQSRAVAGTPVETYLRSRGLGDSIPTAIRFLPDIKHGPTGRRCPCMIAAVTRWPGDDVVAVHRTFLSADGTGKAEVDPSKMTLGPIGGGAVRLAPVGDRLAVTEGIETGLSVLLATGIPTWAALSTGGIRKLVLPPLPMAANVTIAADNDAPGRSAAHDAATRWHAEGRRAWIAAPAHPGEDFNDLMQAADAGGSES